MLLAFTMHCQPVLIKSFSEYQEIGRPKKTSFLCSFGLGKHCDLHLKWFSLSPNVAAHYTYLEKSQGASALLALIHFRSTSGPLPVHFRSTSWSLPVQVHLGPIDGHMRCPIIKFYIKIEFRKILGRSYTDKTSNF